MADLTYEQAITKLEEIVSKLSDGSIGLDESLALFEEGTKLANFCNESLNKAEQKIISLNGDNVNE